MYALQFLEQKCGVPTAISLIPVSVWTSTFEWIEVTKMPKQSLWNGNSNGVMETFVLKAVEVLIFPAED